MASSMQTVAGQDQFQNQNNASQMQYNPTDVGNIRAQEDVLARNTGSQNAFLNNIQNQFSAPGQNFNYGYNTNANLGTNFSAPQLSPQLGAVGQQFLSQAQDQSRAGLGTQLGQIQSQFGQGANANQGLSNILQQQAASQNQLNNNPLMFQAKQAENQAAVTQAGLNNQALEQANTAKIQGGQFQNQGLGMYNQQLGQNLGQAAGYGQQGLSNTNAMMQALQNLGQMFGTQVNAGTSANTNPGLLAKMGSNAGIKTYGQAGNPLTQG